MAEYAYNFTQDGVIAIDTDLQTIECGKAIKGLSIQISSLGTTGVITPEWSNDNTNWVGATIYTPAAVAVTTISAAGLWVTNTKARYFRLRLSTATTVGTTTISTFGFQSTVI